ncbi:MAG: S-adenosylmethionine:tRNA ribosyltransferase-isomerase [Phaeodactylibacter sp.]|nr:S-adenosylmethionine:tRNA ribosyltransferase-isomerase [Phaeodactylibacter sp.]
MPTRSRPASPRAISIDDYDYPLPEERIARFPLEERDASKLLTYRSGQVGHTTFRHIAGQLPAGALLVFNDTKVIHARLHFTLPNGAVIEILCLEPLAPVEHQQNFSSSGPVRWRCLVGGNRKWKSGKAWKTITGPGKAEIRLTATRLGRSADAFDIQFEWEASGLAFGELLALGGVIPLPPYLNRENVPSDEERYQTIYAREQGSVAAPTAGLHFTERTLEDLREKDIQSLFVTLHVGAGTFRPVKTETIGKHHMHEETAVIRREAVASLKEALEAGRPIIPVGTTSTRLLESLYWYGAEVGRRKSEGGNRKSEERPVSGFPLPTRPPTSAGQASHLPFYVSQWQPYETEARLPAAGALQAILDELDAQGLDSLQGQTQLIIAPGYSFRIISGMITNFHQPRSTLLLLIAALIGDDWRRAYRYALDNDFRFLSYGDSSLLLP